MQFETIMHVTAPGGSPVAPNVRRPVSSITPEDMETCLRVLQHIADSPANIVRDDLFKGLISKVYKAGKRDDARAERWRLRSEDRALLAQTGIVRIQRDAVAPASIPSEHARPGRTLNRPECCYICKQDYTEVHFFYHLLCPECAEQNYAMRGLRADLTGRTALLTGGRIKIGYQLALRLLEDGARVLLTTRFPNTAAQRFAAEPGWELWSDRLQIYGLDLRNIPVVEDFARHLLTSESHLDILIHNAAQTIRRPEGFYRELVAQEIAPNHTLSLEARKVVRQDAVSTLAIAEHAPVLLPGVPATMDVLPAHAFADNEERMDSRDTNSWTLKLDEVSTPEMLEVQLVNAVTPFMLNSRLKPLLLRSPFPRRFIINVSAMEGQFRRHKTIYHPHTNMAKAALNMMTRTSGEDYARDGIYMNSVDTGWVTDEKPTPKRERVQQDEGFFAPLDVVDGMARVYHPIATGITSEEEPIFGKLLKDFVPAPW